MKIIITTNGAGKSIEVKAGGHTYSKSFAWICPGGHWGHCIDTVANDFLNTLPLVNGDTRKKLINAMEKAIK